MKTIGFIISLTLTAQLGQAQEPKLDSASLRTQWQREGFAIAMPVMQQGAKYELRIGDTLPATSIQLINGPTDTADIADFRGKYLLLSFWNSSCATCIAAFPKLQQLQKDHSDRLTILPVTYEIEPMVKSTLNRQAERGFPFGLPIIVRDSALRKYFPHQGDPYEVWIDPEGKLVAVTDGDAVTDEAVRRFVEQGIAPQNTARYPFDPSVRTWLTREEYLEQQRKRQPN